MLSKLNRIYFLNCLLVLVILLCLHLPNLNQPFWGHHEFNGVFYGTIARNYHRYGLIQTKTAQVTTAYETTSTQWGYHTHHPATYPLLIYAWTLFFPFNEVSLRSLSLLASFIGLAYWLGVNKNSFTKQIAAFLSILFVLTTPLARYYMSLPVFEPLLFPLVLIGVIAWQKRQQRLLLAMIFLAGLLDWPGYWLGLWVMAVSVWRRDWPSLKSAIGGVVLSGVLIISLQWWAYGNPLEAFIKVGSTRFAFTAQPYTPVEWFKLLLARSRAFLGLPLLLTTLIGTSLLLFRKHWSLVLILGGVGLSHIFVFRNITWYHDYMLYHLLPLLLVATTSLFHNLAKHSLWFFLSLAGVLLIIQLSTTSRFYLDLAAMVPHHSCVEFGKRLSQSSQSLTFRGTQEQVDSCPPFIYFYGQKLYLSEVIE